MENLTDDQIQLILILFQLQNTERDIEDFVPGFHSFGYGFSKYRKIGDLKLYGTWLLADDNDGDEWSIIYWFCNHFIAKFVCNGSFYESHFDIMKHISFEDKV